MVEPSDLTFSACKKVAASLDCDVLYLENDLVPMQIHVKIAENPLESYDLF